LNCHFLREALERVLALQFLELLRGVLVEELVNGEVATAHPDLDVVLLDLNGYSLGAELVDPLRLPHEHDLELGSFGEVVEVLGKLFVDQVILVGDVDGNARLEIDNVFLQLRDFNLGVL